MTLATDITSLGGLAATFELYARGWTKRQLAAAVHSGAIIRVRQGWYANPSTPDVYQRAARVGGRLTCASGAHARGLWLYPPAMLHVAVSQSTSRLRNPHDKTKRLTWYPDAATVVHWTDRRATSDRYVASIRQILSDMVWCYSPEIVVAAVDAALHAGLIRLTEWLEDIAPLPLRLKNLLRRVDVASESFLESVMRFRLSMLGISARLQVHVSGVGRVDLIIGSKLVIELDGWQFHNDRDQFEEDRRRDARLAVLGYRVLRFTYRQLMRRWSVVRASIEACMARGEHH